MIRWLATFATVCLVVAACGSSELEVEPTFDGNWTVSALTVDGTTIDVEQQPIEIEIDTGQAALRGRTTCDRFFGSYTLTDDGSGDGDATFTVPSPAPDDTCDEDSIRAHTAVVETLESITRWQQDGDRLRFQSPNSTLELTPAG